MGFSGRREATNAPTVGNANDSASRTQLKPVECLSPGSERRGNKIATRRRLELRRAATDTRPAKKRRGRSSHLLLDPVPLPFLSQHYLTRLPFPKRYGNRYEAERYGAIAPSTPFLALCRYLHP